MNKEEATEFDMKCRKLFIKMSALLDIEDMDGPLIYANCLCKAMASLSFSLKDPDKRLDDLLRFTKDLFDRLNKEQNNEVP